MTSIGPLGRRATLAAVLFAAGLASGAGVMAVLSARASRLYLQMVRMSVASEQEARMAAAWRRGDVAGTLVHAGCGLEAEKGGRAFEGIHSSWGLGFPIMGAFVTARTKYPVDDSTRLQALAHAKLGIAWEGLGLRDQADQEYAAAGRLTGLNDPDRWRPTARQLVEGIAAQPDHP